jgi:iron-sulfur cluster assembly protein
MILPANQKTIFTVTPEAAGQIRVLLSQRGKSSVGIRIGVKQRGCSGNSYTLEYADNANPLDEIVTHEDLTIYIDPKALLFVIGTVMDFKDDKLESGFTFQNPNEKGRCGCGESFHV